MRKEESVMSEYVIIKANIEGYDRFVLCLSFDSLFTYIEKIEDVLAKNNTSEKILFDQLLITGNSANRFMSCDFLEGKLDFRTAHAVKPNDYFRKETVGWLHKNYCYVENSILTKEQREKIKENVVF